MIVPAGLAGTEALGLSFMGTAWSEAALLRYAFVYESASHQRVPPTVVNPALLKGCGTK